MFGRKILFAACISIIINSSRGSIPSLPPTLLGLLFGTRVAFFRATLDNRHAIIPKKNVAPWESGFCIGNHETNYINWLPGRKEQGGNGNLEPLAKFIYFFFLLTVWNMSRFHRLTVLFTRDIVILMRLQTKVENYFQISKTLSDITESLAARNA